MKRGGVRIAQACDLIISDVNGLLVKVVKAEVLTEARDLRLGFMVAWEYIHAIAAGFQNFSATFESLGPVDEVAGGKIVIGLRGHEAFECLVMAVNVGKNEQLHGFMIAREAARSSTALRGDEEFGLKFRRGDIFSSRGGG